MIRLKNVIKIYQNIPVLNVNELTIEDKTINCFIGSNGAGKSTLIFIICGFVYQTKGEILIDGFSNKSSYMRKNSHIVLESGKGFYEYLTGKENIQYLLGINKIKYKAKEEELQQYIDDFEFSEHIDKKVSELSQGNRQKLSLILAMLLRPKYLAMDEPTNGLDDNAKRVLLQKLYELKENGSTILITTHDSDLIKHDSFNIYEMNKGEIVSIKKGNEYDT
ncbi:ABC-2 type transport system ATP-binding protein [Clostridium sp. USBA 49]|jgi:ABC-2 type transport system ATP-binding protein|uniref:ATP-binding cassette domain-containing protein n=1 Tax=Clostridium TaxID=1485 RepID=UPI00099A4EF1|nr:MULTISPECIES: ABC transporter ATP-binding protein [Clostridium]SKA73030.1 ABC-2 type transport system ATP-binding protein [Clostridium sp. USBA 49]